MHSSPFTRLLIGSAWAALAITSASGQESRVRAVEIRATIRQAPPRIVLQWNDPANAPLLSQKIYRRTTTTAAWTELAPLAPTAKSYTDNAVAFGSRYEYFVYRVYDGPPGTASGWLSAAIRAPLVAERGKVILLVDDTMAGPLATELAQFISDLTGDGWFVIRQDISRNAAVPSVRAAVQAIYNDDPPNTAALILFGHIPVPYSGDYAADGHPDHRGAWPADAYYGDIDGVWTDTTVDSTGASRSENHNIPGDGKFDQSSIPSDVELAVGRVDLSLMPVFGVSETELLRQYLQRDHQFRHRLGAYSSIPRRALIDDTFGFFAGEAFAATGWRSFSALFGSANVRALDWFATLPTQKYLCACGCGPGQGYSGATGVGSVHDFAAEHSLSVFNFLFGSYFGDWNNQDNFLRAPLGGTAASLGLTSAWAGRPHWFVHPMGLGETIGACTRLAQNNLTSFPSGYEANNTERGVHIALMGDPTLRLHPVKPPTNLVAKPGANVITLSWRAGGDSPVEGYLVSRASSPLGPFVRLRGGVAAGTSFADRSVEPGVSYSYMVRAVKKETTPSGSYLNPSQGAFSGTAVATAGAGREFNLTGNGNPVTDGDTAPLAANGTDFGT
ncbi:MAG: fibronectin type III domain-containing protein, partial [Chthoniobacteraceae bacterium]